MKLKVVGLLIATILIFVKCNDSGDDPSDFKGSASVQFILIDNPVDFDAVLIDVQGLEYRLDREDDDGDDDDDDENNESDSRKMDDDDDDDDDGKWIMLDIEPTVYDLLQLNNGAQALLAEAEVEAGDLEEIRVILGNNNKVVVNGDTLDLMVPSGSQSGLKIKIDEDIEDGESYELIIDFDAAKSIVVTGNGKYILKPVIRVKLVDNDDDFGSITGVVVPLDLSSIVYAINSQNDSVSTIPEENGTFLIEMLEEGTYSVVALPNEESGFSPITIENIDVLEEEITVLDSIKFE